MSTERLQRSQLSVHEDVLGCNLHAAMLPLIAAVATFADAPHRGRANAHLQRIWQTYGFQNLDLGCMWSALWKFSGSALEPFHCPLDLCHHMAMACGILARDTIACHGDRGRVLLMNHGIKGAWSGVELDGHRTIPFTCEDFRKRAKRGASSVPPVPLAIDLEQLCSASIVPTKATIQTGTSEPTLVIELPAGICSFPTHGKKPSLHFGHGFTLPRPSKQSEASRSARQATHQSAGRPRGICRWKDTHPIARGPELVPIAGELHHSARTTDGPTLHLPLSPSLMLRLAALPGAKRFVIGVPCNAMAGVQPWFNYSMTVIGAIDASGVRAAVLPWEGWSSTSPEWMPFAPFAPADLERARAQLHPCRDWNPSEDDLCLAGTFDGLVDLLLDLSGTEPTDGSESERESVPQRRIRPISILGRALMRMKRQLESQRFESLQLLKMA